MKKGVLVLLVTLLSALGLCLTLGFAPWAAPCGMGGHWGDGGHQGHWGKFARLTPEQAGKVFDLRQTRPACGRTCW
jgi:Spy/CpxP family protein refolding chaperone